jgi:hypothetical protein
VYWTNAYGGTVAKVPLGGGTPVTLASGQTMPAHIALDGQYVYFTTVDRTVKKVPIAGGATTTVAMLGAPALGIAVDGNGVYLVAGDADTVLNAPLSGGGSPSTLASNQNNPMAIAIDPVNAYFTTFDGSVKQVPLAGGPVTVLATGRNTFMPAITVDAHSVYWLEGSTVMSLGGKTSLGAVRCERGECACPTGTANCFGVCTDLGSDSANCGTCGAACNAGTTCKCGSCR